MKRLRIVTSRPLACEGANSGIYLKGFPSMLAIIISLTVKFLPWRRVLSPRLTRQHVTANLQWSHRASATNGKTNNAAAKNHTPNLACKGLRQRSNCKQHICTKYDFPTTELVRQHSGERARDQRKQAGAGCDEAFIECCQWPSGKV